MIDLCNAADRHSLAVPEFHLAHVYADLTEGSSGAWARRTAQSMVHLAALRRRCLKRFAWAQWKDAMATSSMIVYPIQERPRTQKLPWLTRLELIKLVPRLVKTRCRQAKRMAFIRWQRKTEQFLSESGRNLLTTRTGGGYRLSYARPEDQDNVVDERALSSSPSRRPKHHKKPRRYQDLEYALPARPMCDWTISQVADWFGRGINLPQYRGNVHRKHVNGQTLEQLNSTTVESLVGVWNRSFLSCVFPPYTHTQLPFRSLFRFSYFTHGIGYMSMFLILHVHLSRVHKDIVLGAISQCKIEADQRLAATGALRYDNHHYQPARDVAKMSHRRLLNASQDDVARWIGRDAPEGVGFPQYAVAFRNNHVDGKCLVNGKVNDTSLRLELGVTSKFHRNKILNRIQQIRATYPYPGANLNQSESGHGYDLDHGSDPEGDAFRNLLIIPRKADKVVAVRKSIDDTTILDELENAANRINASQLSRRKYVEDDDDVVPEKLQSSAANMAYQQFSDYYSEPRAQSAKRLRHMHALKVKGLDAKERWKLQQRDIDDKMMRSGIDSTRSRERRPFPMELKDVLVLTGLRHERGYAPPHRASSDVHGMNRSQAIRKGRRIRESLMRLCSAIDLSGLRLGQVFTAMVSDVQGKSGFSKEFGMMPSSKSASFDAENHMKRSDFLLACKRMKLGLSSSQLLQMSSALFGDSNDDKSIEFSQFVDIMTAVYNERQTGLEMILRTSLEEGGSVNLDARSKKSMLNSIEKGANIIADTGSTF